MEIKPKIRVKILSKKVLVYCVMFVIYLSHLKYLTALIKTITLLLGVMTVNNAGHGRHRGTKNYYG